MITVLHDTFKDFDIGPFPYDPKHSAFGEYHYYPSEGYHGEWHDPVVWYGWLGPTWLVTENNGTMYMEQTRPQAAMNELWPTLVKGEVSWTDYTMEATIRPLSTFSHTGIAFRYQHGRRYYFFGLDQGQACLLKRDQSQIEYLDATAYSYDSDHEYRLRVECSGSSIKGYINDQLFVQTVDDSYEHGKIGLIARMPAQYTDVHVTMTAAQHEGWLQKSLAEEEELAKLRANMPQPKLWKSISLRNFGTARQIRLGHLTGEKELQLVLAQHQKRGHKDAYAHISCLTAMDLDGKVLWQLGDKSYRDFSSFLKMNLSNFMI